MRNRLGNLVSRLRQGAGRLANRVSRNTNMPAGVRRAAGAVASRLGNS